MDSLPNDLDKDKVNVDQDIKTDRNIVYIIFCSCFNWLV